jgi:hypothetical protein
MKCHGDEQILSTTLLEIPSIPGSLNIHFEVLGEKHVNAWTDKTALLRLYIMNFVKNNELQFHTDTEIGIN